MTLLADAWDLGLEREWGRVPQGTPLRRIHPAVQQQIMDSLVRRIMTVQGIDLRRCEGNWVARAILSICWRTDAMPRYVFNIILKC